MSAEERAFGTLTRLSDELVERALEWSTPQDLLQLSGTCRFGYALTIDQSVWRDFCMEEEGPRGGRVCGKIARFQFKVNWKYTYFRPEAVPLDAQGAIPRPLSEDLPAGFYTVAQTRKQRWYSRRNQPRDIPLRGHPLERVSARDVGPAEFFERFDSKNRPVIVEGAVEAWGWQAMRHADFLRSHAGTVFKTNGVTESGRTLRMTYAEYTSYVRDAWGQGDKPMYIFDNKFHERAEGLTSRYCIPPYFREDLFDCMSKADRPDYRWLLIGPPGSGAPFHTDPHMTHAWNVVTEGRKRIAFYPPDVIPPGVNEALIHTEYYAAKDTLEWYLEVYPRLRAERLPLEGIVEAGEMVFIPSGWWHQVLNVAPITIAVTQNVCSRGNFNRVWCELQKRGPKSLEARFKRDCLKAGYKELFDAYVPPPDLVSDDEASFASTTSDSTSNSDTTDSDSDSSSS